MNYASIRNNDIANGEGVRVSLFVSGCNFHCPGCFNQEAQDFEYGNQFTNETKEEIIKMVSEPTISGLSILGGDPMCQDFKGITHLLALCNRVHMLGKTVWIWSGYTFSELYERIPGTRCPKNGLMRYFLMCTSDVFVDGPFIQELADRKLVWRGSSNQRVIDVKASLRSGFVVEYQNGSN